MFSLQLKCKSANSGNLMNHWSMNWAQFKDPISHMCLAGAVVASWSLTQELAGSNPFSVMTNNSLNLLKTFRKYFNVGLLTVYWKWSLIIADVVFSRYDNRLLDFITSFTKVIYAMHDKRLFTKSSKCSIIIFYCVTKPTQCIFWKRTILAFGNKSAEASTRLSYITS